MNSEDFIASAPTAANAGSSTKYKLHQIHPKQGKIFPKVLESNFVKQVWKHHKNSECCPVPFFVFVFFLICSPLWSNVSNIIIILGNSLTTNLMFQNQVTQWVSECRGHLLSCPRTVWPAKNQKCTYLNIPKTFSKLYCKGSLTALCGVELGGQKTKKDSH